MRLPWPFRRDRSPRPTDAAVAPAAPNGWGEWRSLPPLDETLGPPPIVAPVAPFADGLAVRRGAPPSLAPLTHYRSLNAPAGIVVGIARPISGPLQRAALPLRRSRAAAGEHATADLADDGRTELVESAYSAGPPVVTTPRQLPVVGAPRVGRDLVHLGATDTKPLPVAPPAGVLYAARRASSPTPSPAVAEPIGQTLPTEPTATATPTPELPAALPRQSSGSRLSLAQSRRAGLGAPLRHVPQTARPPAGLQRAPAIDESTAADPIGAHSSEPPPVLPATKLQSVRHDASIVDPGRPAEAGPVEPLAPAKPAAPPHTTPAVLLGRAPTRPVVRSQAPILASRPLRSSVQRAPMAATSRAGRNETVPSDAGQEASGAVRVHRGTAASAAAGELEARAFTHEGEIYLPAHHGPLTGGAARSLLAHEVTHVAQQRLYGSSLPGEDTSEGRRLEAEARAAESNPQLPLVLTPARSARSSEAATSAVSPAATREVLGEAAAATTQTAATELGAGSESLTSVVQLSAIQRAEAGESAPAAAVSTGAATGGRSEQELEELARQLYGRIRHRLRRELILDRERAGVAVDV